METRRIPLFPLNVVLFPGMPLPLHVFEPRYQVLVRHCLEGDRTFGVCLIRSGPEVGGDAEPYEIGTTCEILETNPVGEGRMQLLTIGRERFRIHRLYRGEQPYLEGEVEELTEEPGEFRDLPGRVRDTVAEYIAGLLAMQGEREREFTLPADPALLSYVVGAVLQIEPVRLQKLLELDVTADRLSQELEILLDEREKQGEILQRAHVAQRLRVDPEQISQN